MNEPQEIPEARAAANKVRDILGISTTDFKFEAVFAIITEACREYAKMENAFITKCAFDSAEVMAKENAHLRQQLSALQKENAQFQTLWDLLPEIENKYQDRLVIHLREKIETLQKENKELLKQLTATLASNDHFQDLLEKADKDNEMLRAVKLHHDYCRSLLNCPADDVLAESIETLQKENESFRVQASEECDAKHRAFDRVERAESRAEKAERGMADALELLASHNIDKEELTTLREDVKPLLDYEDDGDSFEFKKQEFLSKHPELT